ncbi:hypothetical protein Salat_1127900 [Sesamum alatum]|uniref:Uncharacterized protein n=1 Tax=Sesamum alatum TaxID=300844 RepID=A0AAE2CN36_9LAMI|nr:hypothetical protein Salat_1127900 [Sesamum alatum]
MVGTPDIQTTQKETSITPNNLDLADNEGHLPETYTVEKDADALHGNLRTEKESTNFEAGILETDCLHDPITPLKNPSPTTESLPTITTDSLDSFTINNPCTLHHAADLTSHSLRIPTLDHTHGDTIPIPPPMQPTSPNSNPPPHTHVSPSPMQNQPPSPYMQNIPLSPHEKHTQAPSCPPTVPTVETCDT